MTSIVPIPSAADEIWFSRCPTPTTFGLALQRGVIGNDATGLAPYRWLALQGSPDPATQRAHFTHAKGRCFRHGGNVPPIWARSEGAATRLIGLSWMRTPQPILALPESGIRDVRDLRGKRLLVMTRPESEIDFWQAVTLRVYETALAAAGMGLDDVTLVRVPSARPDVVRADASANNPHSLWPLLAMSALNRETLLPLVRGEVDAVASQGHNAMQLAALLGATIIFDQGALTDAAARVNNDVPDALTVSADLLDDDPDFVIDVLVALLQTDSWVQDHEAEAAKLLAPELNIAEQLLGIAYGGAIGPGTALDLSVEWLAAIASQKEFLLRHGFVTRDFDLDRWIDPRPLAAARQRLATRTARTAAPAA